MALATEKNIFSCFLQVVFEVGGYGGGHCVCGILVYVTSFFSTMEKATLSKNSLCLVYGDVAIIIANFLCKFRMVLTVHNPSLKCWL